MRGENNIDDAAARWIARLDRLGVDEESIPELQEWLAADTRHRGAFVRAQAAWLMLDSGQGLSTPASKAEQLEPSAFPRRAALAGLAASAVAALALFPMGRSSTAEARKISTGFGEVRRFDVHSGLTMVLDEQSSVELDVLDNACRTRLTRGGAWFELRRATSSETLVSSGDLRVSGAEASFALRHSPECDLVVAAGSVDVDLASQGPRQRYRIGKGMRVQVGADGIGRIGAIPPASIAKMLAWREGKIDLDGETLSAAAANFNRYNRRKIVIEDDRLGQEKVVGLFAIHEPEQFAEAAAMTFDGMVRMGPNTIVIARR